MLAAIFKQRLPIQIVVTDSVANSKTKVRISNRQLVACCRFKKTVIIVSRMQFVIYAPGTKTNQAVAWFQ